MIASRPAPTVRDATPDDAEEIRRVAVASWWDTYGEVLDHEYIRSFLDEAYSVEGLRAAAAQAMERDTSTFLVAERDGELIAYLQFGEGARGPELYRLYADPAHQRTGVGGALLAELHRRIGGRVASYVLEVHSRNERGRAFYERNGFVLVGAGATPDCDLTMRRTLVTPNAGLPVATARLRLRSLTDDDAEPLHAIYGDAETMRYIGATGTASPDLERTRLVLAWLRRHEAHHGFSLWAVDELETGTLVGVTGLIYEEGRGPEIELAYLFRRDRWGRGYATEAARAALDVGHGALGLRRIVALAYAENPASHHVMAKAGMTPDGEVQAYGGRMTGYVSETHHEGPGEPEETGARSGLRISRAIAAPADWTYRAVTDPALVAQWLWPWDPVVEVDAREAGAYRFAADHPTIGHLEVSGRYLEVRPPELVRFTWRWLDADEADDTIVTIGVAASPDDPNASELVLLHEGFPDQATRDDHVTGWNNCLDRLTSLAASQVGTSP